MCTVRRRYHRNRNGLSIYRTIVFETYGPARRADINLKIRSTSRRGCCQRHGLEGQIFWPEPTRPLSRLLLIARKCVLPTNQSQLPLPAQVVRQNTLL